MSVTLLPPPTPKNSLSLDGGVNIANIAGVNVRPRANPGWKVEVLGRCRFPISIPIPIPEGRKEGREGR